MLHLQITRTDQGSNTDHSICIFCLLYKNSCFQQSLPTGVHIHSNINDLHDGKMWHNYKCYASIYRLSSYQAHFVLELCFMFIWLLTTNTLTCFLGTWCSEIWGSHGSEYNDHVLFRYYIMQSHKEALMYWMGHTVFISCPDDWGSTFLHVGGYLPHYAAL